MLRSIYTTYIICGIGVVAASISFFALLQTVRGADTQSQETTVQFQVGTATCGNGILEAGEACDDGGSNGSCPAACSATCTINSCGGGGGGDTPVVQITTTEATYSTVMVTWTASNGPITACDTAWGTASLAGPYPSSTSAYTEVAGVFSTTIGGLAPETTYYIEVTCTNTDARFGSDRTEQTTSELPDMIDAEVTIIAIPEKRVPRSGGNLDTEFTVFIFDPSETVLLTTISGTSETDGIYVGVHEVPVGDGYIAIHKSDSHLAKKVINVTFAEADNTLDFAAGGTFALIAGDVRPDHSLYATLRDNRIEILDITYIDSNTIINTDDRTADLNRDGIVDILDLTLVDGNADLQGDVIPIL